MGLSAEKSAKSRKSAQFTQFTTLWAALAVWQGQPLITAIASRVNLCPPPSRLTTAVGAVPLVGRDGVAGRCSTFLLPGPEHQRTNQWMLCRLSGSSSSLV
jgi:hypothetical protein